MTPEQQTLQQFIVDQPNLLRGQVTKSKVPYIGCAELLTHSVSVQN